MRVGGCRMGKERGRPKDKLNKLHCSVSLLRHIEDAGHYLDWEVSTMKGGVGK